MIDNPTLSLDIADKAIKLIAVLIGGLWTWWNFRKSRTYEQRLELEISGNVFAKGDLYGDVRASVKNIGGTRHSVHQAGTSCELFTVDRNLTERFMDAFPVFVLNEHIEPSESIDESIFWRIPQPIEDIVWVKLVLRVASNKIEWSTSCLIRVDAGESTLTALSTR